MLRNVNNIYSTTTKPSSNKTTYSKLIPYQLLYLDAEMTVKEDVCDLFEANTYSGSPLEVFAGQELEEK